MTKRSQTIYLEDGSKKEVNMDTEYVEQAVDMHDQEHKTMEDVKPSESPVIDDTLMEIPEIKMLVTYYHDEINKLKADTRMQPFMKKMKLKALQKEFRYVAIGMQGITRLLKQLETDPDNLQHQADINAIGEAFALRCQRLMLSRNLQNPRQKITNTLETPEKKVA